MVRIVDTSVVIKWFVEEGDSALAIPFIGTQLAAPELLLAEMGHAFWKKWRKQEVTVEQVDMVNSFVTSFVEIFSGEPLAEDAVRIAIELNHPVYDCYFLAMAEAMDARLITFDRRLRTVCLTSRFADRIDFLGNET